MNLKGQRTQNNNLIGQKFGRLTVIKQEGNVNNRKLWKCICVCNKEYLVPTNRLTTGITQSCGCLKEEVCKEKGNLLLSFAIKYEPKIASARRIWKRYLNLDNKCDISFDDFNYLIQQNCNYCGVEPSMEFNTYDKNYRQSSYTRGLEEGTIFYNSLDRIDSSKFHTIDNVVSCCSTCNMAKSNYSLNDFLSWTNNLKIQQKPNYKILNLPTNNYLFKTINSIYKERYNDGNLTNQEFYSISQNNCFYCNCGLSNKFNKYQFDKRSSAKAIMEGTFYYNGLDRLYSKDYSTGKSVRINHDFNSCVSCCQRCNWSKSDSSVEDFHNWITRIQNFQKSKNII